MISSNTWALMTHSFHSFFWVLIVITGLLHLVIAAGIAKDISERQARYYPTQLIPGYAWVLSVLLTGLWGMGIYWLMHHSSLAREVSPSKSVVRDSAS